jgi:hypothetical protein
MNVRELYMVLSQLDPDLPVHIYDWQDLECTEASLYSDEICLIDGKVVLGLKAK